MRKRSPNSRSSKSSAYFPPDCNSRLKPFADVTARDVLSRLHREPVRAGGADGLADDMQRMALGTGVPQALGTGVPQVMHSSVRLPVNFMLDLPPQNFPNRFPNDPGYIVPLHAALQRGVSLKDIDFVLGGSALDVLANRTHVDPQFDPEGGCSSCRALRAS